MDEAKIIEVSDGEDGSRLDKWLKKHVPSMPNSLMYKLFRKRAFKVDGKRAKADYKLIAGQSVRIPPMEEREINERKKEYRVSDYDRKMIRSSILFEDEHIIAINKPAGLAVQGGTNTKRHLDGIVTALVGKNETPPKIVHRLDKDTSGVMLLAKTDKAARELGFMFKGKDIRKCYWALTVPAPDMDNGTIRGAIRKAGGEGKEKMIIDEEKGKKSTTEFVIIDRAHNKAAFVAFWPRTGRTHQIRVHAAQALGTPILGDGKYGGKGAFLEGDLEIPKKVHLHARNISLNHPLKNGRIDVTAPLPDDMIRSWKELGFNPNHKGDPFKGIE